MSGTQMMLELTVVFGNPNIPNHTLLVEHRDGDDFLADIRELRAAAEEQLRDKLTDEQCFYRLFTRDAPTD